MSEHRGSSAAINGDHITMTIAPDHARGVSVGRFVAALRAADALLTAMDPNAEPVLYWGGGVAADGAVTIEAGPSRMATENKAST